MSSIGTSEQECMNRQVVNIVNFVRGCEPRAQMDLVRPVLEQIALLKAYGLPGTFLVQYDAFIREDIRSLLEKLDDSFEIGVWLEANQPLIERSGIEWRGRRDWQWDYDADIAFTPGYRPEERRKIVDVLFNDFKRIFGSFPSSVGSWFVDAPTLEYMYREYDIGASCNCKDQWGTDGYTIWGGYYGQGYYPSRYNMLCPAQTRAAQIDVPVFRMLGSDPIYQYQAGSSSDGAAERQPVITLEPVYWRDGGGGDSQWVDWFFRENYNGLCNSFGYAQVGQENSFGWEAMEVGLRYQIRRIKMLRDEGRVSVETLGETGAWYKRTFAVTPASSIVATTDWREQHRRSAWFSCKNYRTNLYFSDGRFRIRDLFLFDEEYEERYLTARCTSNVATYDNLPVVDGNRWSGNGLNAGIELVIDSDHERDHHLHPAFSTEGDTLSVSFETSAGECCVSCDEKTIRIEMSSRTLWHLELRWKDGSDIPFTSVADATIACEWYGHSYSLGLAGCRCDRDDTRILIQPCGSIIEITPKRTATSQS